jgi:hypothetical protein
MSCGWSVALVVAFAGWVGVSPVLACQPNPCRSGEFLPGDGGHVPANAPALGWRPPVASGEPRDPSAIPAPRLVRLDTGEQVDLDVVADADADFMLLVVSKLEAGTRYRLASDFAAAEGCTTEPVEFEVTETAPLPSQLGMPTMVGSARRDISVFTTSGSCFAPLPVVQLSIDLAQATEVTPWWDLLVHQTVVDGELWSHAIAQPPAAGSAVLFSECEPEMGQEVDPGIVDRGLLTGTHSMRFEANLLGANTLRSSELTVELRCADAQPVQTSDAGCSAVAAPATRSGFVALPVLGALLGLSCRRLRRRRD